MNLTYGLLINQLKKRRFDEALRESILSESFEKNIPLPVKYARECMLEIDPSYSVKIFQSARKIHTEIESRLKRRGYKIDLRFQGSAKINCNISLYGTLEMLIIRKRISEKPHQDIKSIAIEILDILSNFSGEFKSYDFDDETRIKIQTFKPTCKIDILPSMWIDTKMYLKTNQEVYRGIAEFNFAEKKTIKYMPFLNIARITSKNNLTNGNYLCLVRLMKCLCEDFEKKIDLSTTEIAGMLYAIPNRKIYVKTTHILSLLPLVKKLISKLIKDEKIYNEIMNPSQSHRIFYGKDKRPELNKLRVRLHALIEDIKEALAAENKTLEDEIVYDDYLSE